jgi:hypothetical protein
MANYSATATGISSPLFVAIRTFLPPSTALKRTRVPLHDLAGVNRLFALDDAARGVARRRPSVPLHEVHALDQHPVVLSQHELDLAGLPLVLATDDDDAVAFVDARGHLRSPPAPVK